LAWQVGVGGAQSLFCRQTTHCPSGAHSLSGACPAQSVFVKHCTHVEVVVSHSGAAPWHWAFDVQPARQVKSCGSQMGCAVPQSTLSRHCTHRPSATRHRGASGGQSVFTAHSTHDCVIVSQILAVPAQGVVGSHPTQTPGLDAVSQTAAFFGQSAFVAHPAWHA
jgi:hypothetical protein